MSTTKAIKQTLASIGPRQAVIIGREGPTNPIKGAVVLTFGKTYALQQEATNVVESLPAKITAAVKAIVEGGGVVTAKVAKAAGVDFGAIVTKLMGNKSVSTRIAGVDSNAKPNKIVVTPKAKRADLIAIDSGNVTKAKPAKAEPAKSTKATPKKEVKPAAKTPAKKPATKAAPKKEVKAPAKATKATPKKETAKKVEKKAPAKATKKETKPAKAAPKKEAKKATKADKPKAKETKKADKKSTKKEVKSSGKRGRPAKK